jgi:hypothetical protein
MSSSSRRLADAYVSDLMRRGEIPHERDERLVVALGASALIMLTFTSIAYVIIRYVDINREGQSSHDRQ